MKLTITFVLFCSLLLACEEESIINDTNSEGLGNDTVIADSLLNVNDSTVVDTVTVVDNETLFEPFYSNITSIYAPGDYITVPVAIDKINQLDSVTLTKASNLEINEFNLGTQVIIPDNYIIDDHKIWSMHQLKGYKNGEVLLQIDSLKIFRSRDIFNYVEVEFKDLRYMVRDSSFLAQASKPEGESKVNIDDETKDYSFTINLTYNLYLPEIGNGSDQGEKGTHYRQFGTYQNIAFPYVITQNDNMLDIKGLTYIIKRSTTPAEGRVTEFETIKSLKLEGFSIEDEQNTHRFQVLLDNIELSSISPSIIDINSIYESELMSSGYYFEHYIGKTKYNFDFSSASNLKIVLERR